MAYALPFTIFCDDAGCFPETRDELESAPRQYRGHAVVPLSPPANQGHASVTRDDHPFG